MASSQGNDSKKANEKLQNANSKLLTVSRDCANASNSSDAKTIKRENEYQFDAEKTAGTSEISRDRAPPVDTKRDPGGQGDASDEASDDIANESTVSLQENLDNANSNEPDSLYGALPSSLEMVMPAYKLELNLDAEDLSEQFKLFKYEHEQKMTLGKVATADKESRAAAFTLDLPPEARRILMNTDWTKNNRDKHSIDDIIAVVCEAKRKKSSKILAKNKFHNRMMSKNEKFVSYRQTLLILIEQCGYPSDLNETMVRDQIIRGHYDEELRRKMLELDDAATLAQVSEICEKHEDTREAAKELGPPARSHQSNAVNDRQRRDDGKKSNQGGKGKGERNGNDKAQLWTCTNFCGGRHVRGHQHCKAYGTTCTKCGRRNHFEEVCRKPPLAGWVPRSKAAEEHHKKMIEEKVYSLHDYSEPYDEHQRSSESPRAAYNTDTDPIRADSSDTDNDTPPREVKLQPARLRVTTRSTNDLRNHLKHDGRKHPERSVELISEAVEIRVQSNDKMQFSQERKSRRDRRSPRHRHRSPSPTRRRTRSRSRSRHRHERRENRRDEHGDRKKEAKPKPSKQKVKDKDPDTENEAGTDSDTPPENESSNQVSQIRRKPRTWDENVSLNGKMLRMKIDSGSTVNTLSLADFQRLGFKEDILEPSKTTI